MFHIFLALIFLRNYFVASSNKRTENLKIVRWFCSEQVVNNVAGPKKFLVTALIE